MTYDVKNDLHRRLTSGREALQWKIEGLSEYDVRRPLTPTGTNLLGLLKHVAAVTGGYFGDTFGRPFPEPMPWIEEDAPDNADMWATADESREMIVGLYERVWTHADATITELDLDSPGQVPWWGPKGDVTLLQIMIHIYGEVERHAGHADIVAELIDGRAGLSVRNSNLPDHDAEWWATYRETVEAAAREASGTR